jgi:hypothetical protein
MAELVEQAGETHAQHPFMDTTLCGMALEGDEPPTYRNPSGYGNFAAAEPARTQRLTCGDCVQIVKAARAIPARCLPK